MSSPIISPEPGTETTEDQALRPLTWGDFIGQEQLKENVRLILEAARQRGEAPDHLLFYGPAGLGKTTLAHIVGRELGAGVRVTTGPSFERAADVAAILSNMEPREVLFVDEIHRMSRAAEEVLYPALESRKLHLVVGKGPAAKTFSLDLPPFTVVGATTKANMLSAPLRSRFGAIFHLGYYRLPDIEAILTRSANLLGLEVAPEALAMLAEASRFTPRTANRLLRRARDYAQVHNGNTLDTAAVRSTLGMLQVDARGLEEADRTLLRTIAEKFRGGPVGVRALAAALHEETGTIEDVYEPFLMTLGFLNRTPLGRVITEEGRKHLEQA